MLQLKKILVPRDFSPCGEEALLYALDLARRVGAEVRLLFVEVLLDVPDPTATHPSYRRILRERLLEDIEPELVEGTPDSEEVQIKPALVSDVAPAPAIVSYAKRCDIDLIVMGTHGRRGVRRLLLGSTAEEVVRTAPCPVFTVRSRDPSAAVALKEIASILVPLDFSRHSQTALCHAKELAAVYDARLDLLHVVEDRLRLHPAFYNTDVMTIAGIDPDLLGKAAEELRQFYRETEGPDTDVDIHVWKGHAAHEIIRFATEHGSDLVVMSTHGLGGLEHFLLGSVAEKVVRRSPAPVFTVKAFGKALVPLLALAEAKTAG